MDELHVHLAPLPLGDGPRLLDGVDPRRVSLALGGAADSPRVTHLRYRLRRR